MEEFKAPKPQPRTANYYLLIPASPLGSLRSSSVGICMQNPKVERFIEKRTEKQHAKKSEWRQRAFSYEEGNSRKTTSESGPLD